MWVAVLAAGLVAVGAVALRPPAQAAPAGPAVGCADPSLRAAFEAVYDRHRVRLREARLRVQDERYALRRLLTSPQATRAQLDAQAARAAEAAGAWERARAEFLWELREALPGDRREALVRCVVGPRFGPRGRWR